MLLFFIAFNRIQYQFEDEPFDTVPDLITFYVGSGRAISAASGNFSTLMTNNFEVILDYILFRCSYTVSM